MRSFRRLCTVATMVSLFVCGMGDAKAVPNLQSALPNIKALAPFDIKMGTADGDNFFGPKRALRFSVGSVNRGNVPLELLGIPTSPDSASTDQCVAWIEASICGEYRTVGRFIYHPQHQHWHFDGYATYVLYPSLPDGSPDLSRPPAAGGNKISFCLADSYSEEPRTIPIGRYTEFCPGVIQGISPGWMDMYGSDLAGQQIVISGVPDGSYSLVITINPERTLLETEYGDNMAFFGPIEIAGGQLVGCSGGSTELCP